MGGTEGSIGSMSVFDDAFALHLGYAISASSGYYNPKGAAIPLKLSF
jgi:hypothetical protein